MVGLLFLLLNRKSVSKETETENGIAVVRIQSPLPLASSKVGDWEAKSPVTDEPHDPLH